MELSMSTKEASDDHEETARSEATVIEDCIFVGENKGIFIQHPDSEGYWMLSGNSSGGATG